MSVCDGVTLDRVATDMALISGLVSRFGLGKASNSLVGHIDGVFSGFIRGWVDGGATGPVSLIVKRNGDVLGRCQANQFRVDLMEQGVRNGRCGFSLALLKVPEIRLGDVFEVIEAHAPNRKLSVKMTAKVFNKTLGLVDLVAPDRVAGWVCLPWQPTRQLTVEVRAGNRKVATATASLARDATPGASDGRGGFDIELLPVREPTLVRTELSVHCVESGREIPISDTAKDRAGEGVSKGKRSGETRSSGYPDASRHPSGHANSNSDSDASSETLQEENKRLRTVLSEYESERAFNRLQLQQLQEEMEHWFLRYLELQKALSEGTTSLVIDPDNGKSTSVKTK